MTTVFKSETPVESKSKIRRENQHQNDAAPYVSHKWGWIQELPKGKDGQTIEKPQTIICERKPKIIDLHRQI